MNKTRIERIPINLIDKANNITKMANLPHKINAFDFMNVMQPIIINEKSFSIRNSKDIIKHIDVRYVFKIKNGA